MYTHTHHEGNDFSILIEGSLNQKSCKTQNSQNEQKIKYIKVSLKDQKMRTNTHLMRISQKGKNKNQNAMT